MQDTIHLLWLEGLGNEKQMQTNEKRQLVLFGNDMFLSTLRPSLSTLRPGLSTLRPGLRLPSDRLVWHREGNGIGLVGHREANVIASSFGFF